MDKDVNLTINVDIQEMVELRDSISKFDLANAFSFSPIMRGLAKDMQDKECKLALDIAILRTIARIHYTPDVAEIITTVAIKKDKVQYAIDNIRYKSPDDLLRELLKE